VNEKDRSGFFEGRPFNDKVIVIGTILDKLGEHDHHVVTFIVGHFGVLGIISLMLFFFTFFFVLKVFVNRNFFLYLINVKF